MSGGTAAIQWLQVGKQTGTTDSPATTFLDPQTDITPGTVQNKLYVDTKKNDGELSAPILGTKSATFSFDSLVRGKGSGAGVLSGAGVAAVGGELDALFDCLFGAAGSHGTGVTSGSSHDTDTIKMATTSGFPVGNGLLIDSDSTSGTRYEAREVISVVTDTSVDLDRALQGTPANSTTAYASTSWYADADDTDHSHCYFILEGEDFRRDYWGCGLKLSLNGPAGGLAKWSWQVFANHWSDVAEANPTYSAPTSAAGLSVMGSPFYIGATKTELIDFTLDYGWECEPRDDVGGYNGHTGYIYRYAGATFTGRIYHSDTTLATMQSTSTIDIGWQLGDVTSSSTPGNCLYHRIPALAVETATIETFKGIKVINFTGRATRPSAGSGSVRMHLFASAA